MAEFTDKRKLDTESEVNETDKKARFDDGNNGDSSIVTCVALRVDGTIEEIKLDTSPEKRAAELFLGGPCTMIGEWSDINVVLIAQLEFDHSGDGKALNVHKLQPPFHKYVVYGDILLMKLGDDSEPCDFNMVEYDRFSKIEMEPWELEEEDEEEESDLVIDESFKSNLIDKLVEQYRIENKLADTDEITQEAMDQILTDAETIMDSMQGSDDGGEDESGDGGEDESDDGSEDGSEYESDDGSEDGSDH